MAITGISASKIRVPVKALSTSNVTKSGAQTIDGVALVAGDLVGLVGQSDVKNGVYLVQAGTWLACDPAVGTGLEIYALNGGSNANKVYGADTTGAIVWGTTSVTFTLKSSSGAAFDPASPGAIGGTTPAAITGTVVTANTDVVLKQASLPSAATGYLKLLTGLSNNLVMLDQSGNQLGLKQVSASGTASVSLDVLAASLDDSATVDYDNLGKGGVMLLVNPGATGSIIGIVSFAQNATTTTGGQTWTNFSTTLTTALKINVGASGGKVRIENKTGSTQEIYALVLLGLHV